jgi:Zn-dependent peptidase ImmA (M78 family)/DNA-binding XRE family transcriptional regulator
MSTRAKIRPELLVWARTTSGYSEVEAAKKVQVSEEKYTEWESGDSQPTITQLRKLANAFKRPINLFFLPAPPEQDEANFRDFRQLEFASPISPKTHLIIRNALEVRSRYLELEEALGHRFEKFALEWSVDADPEKIGLEIREDLKVALAEQAAWRTEYEALNGWKRALENVGIFVLQYSIPTSELRGVSLYHDILPIIIVSSSDAPNGRVFSLLHELGHLGLRQNGVCDQSASSRSKVEMFCNATAGAVLIPKHDLLERIGSKSGVWSDLEIDTLAKSYSVSRFVVLRRLLTIKRTTQDFYSLKHQQWVNQVPPDRSGGFAPPFRKRLSELGASYCRSVLANYYADNINLSDVSQLLSLKTKHIPAIEREVL